MQNAFKTYSRTLGDSRDKVVKRSYLIQLDITNIS